MSRTKNMSKEAVQSSFDRESGDDFVELLEIALPNEEEPLRFVNKAIVRLLDEDGFELEDQYGTPAYGCMHKGKHYFYLPFSMPLPTSEPGQAPKSSIELNNLTREMMPYIRQIKGRPDVRIIVVHTSDLDIIQAEFTGLQIANFDYNEETITADLGMNMLTDTAYPAHNYTPDWCPGMF